MAGPRAWQSPRQNPPPTGEENLAKATPKAPINDSRTPSHTPAVSHVPTPTPALPPAPAKLVAKYIDANLQRVTQLALESFVQGQQQAQSQIALLALEPQERLLKAQFLNPYYSNSHMDCYWFCQKCKNYFEIAGAKRPNKILFAALFLMDWLPSNGSNINDAMTEPRWWSGKNSRIFFKKTSETPWPL